MSKHLLEKTKLDFCIWLHGQDNDLRYGMITTGFDENTQLAKFRRLYIKLLNDRNLRKLKS